MDLYTTSGYRNDYYDTRHFYSEPKDSGVPDDRSQILTWLSPLEPKIQHRGIQDRRVNDVGGWLLQTEEFKRWCELDGESESVNRVLFCYGNPGVGKTFISSLVVDWLSDNSTGQNTAVTSFFFDFGAGKDQSATSVLGSLLWQVVNGMERIQGRISRALREQRRLVGGRWLQLGSIVKMLQAITSSHPTFICIDGVDECEGLQRVELLDSLQAILKKSSRTRIFLTGRPHIRAQVEKGLSHHMVSVSISPTKDDIIKYLRTRLGKDERSDAMDESLEAGILGGVPQHISEIFLLASLNIDGILQEPTIHGRREMLSKITDGLDLGDAYCATIGRIKAQGGNRSRLGIGALMWISYAERRLTVQELCHALEVHVGHTKFNVDNIPSVTTLVVCCQGLIVVDQETSTVRLIHSTLQRYLSSNPEIFGQPHADMAEICLTYLNSKHVSAMPADTSSTVADTSFLKYCSIYWGVHAKKGLSAHAKSLALELFREYDTHPSTKLLLEQVQHLRWDISRGSDEGFRFSGLHCASSFGIVDLVAALIGMECYDINEGDFAGHTPLIWAAYNAHGEVVKMLLDLGGVKPDEPNMWDNTPLSYAAAGGHEEVVKILLGREEVNPEKPNNCGKTPLSYAACGGHEGVVKILLRREGVNPDKPCDMGRTPLLYAAKNGHEEVVKILLQREQVNPDKPDRHNTTPLLYAAMEGHEEVVEILLGCEDVNPERPDGIGRTPLSEAARYGHEGVVEILLRRQEVNPDKPCDMGRTPLWYAAVHGHEEVVKILVDRVEVNPDKPDNSGQTPLARAACGGHEGVVKILLRLNDVNPDKPCNMGRRPLSYAARYGHEGIVKILLQLQQVSPDESDDRDGTPLLYAAAHGHEEVVNILLERGEVNPDKPDDLGQTPLSRAAYGGHQGVVKILLEREDVNPDKPCDTGQTPLWYAAALGREEVVKILLDQEEVNPDEPDNFGHTPLQSAAWGGHEGVVKILLRREEVNPHNVDCDGGTPLSRAIAEEHEGVVKILSELREAANLKNSNCRCQKLLVSVAGHDH